ncbi:oligopeptide/dipeptide ABC transporter ATP-binding protein [Bradyrhizobium valentinum]|uniref:oligopeptide/dipeptide ABC transporter ATP-binding protein n=1 Tax=Bradyrhizobium valentinum TaxID=1518501 RepID=UPI000A859E35|nr:oligopeptide/dipeptide ABC transporter ATP-binding protein [Bradyrhizobium valentinum]
MIQQAIISLAPERASGAAALRAENLAKDYPIRQSFVPWRKRSTSRVLHPLSLSIARNRMLGLVGESGSGKSTVGSLLLGISAPSSGQVWLGDEPVLSRRDQRWRAQRRKMQLVHQDPASALDQRRPILKQVIDPLSIHKPEMSIAERRDVASAMLAKVGLGFAYHERRPSELSGGQKQRVVLARALILKPQFVVYDEAVSALDMTIQRHVLELISELQQDLCLSSLFISHDLSCVHSVCDEVAVLYRGHLVEAGDVRDLFRSPAHPYTRVLFASIPSLDEARGPSLQRLAAPSDTSHASASCPFAERCPVVQPVCKQIAPSMRQLGSNHRVSCHFPQDGAIR